MLRSAFNQDAIPFTAYRIVTPEQSATVQVDIRGRVRQTAPIAGWALGKTLAALRKEGCDIQPLSQKNPVAAVK